ncbi:PP2C family protein-serine/threonine phosphatase, partial [Geodermatophilus sp. SYSU D00742]
AGRRGHPPSGAAAVSGPTVAAASSGAAPGRPPHGAAGRSGIDVGELLQQVEDAAPIEAVEVLAAALADQVGARAVSFLIADFSGRAVVRLSSSGPVTGARTHHAERAETVPLAGTVFDQVLRSQQVDVRPEGDLHRVLVPVTDRGDAIGLVEILLPQAPTPREVRQVRSAAHALAYAVIAARRHTDVFEWGMRSTPFSLAAEIQRRLLPAAYTCEAAQFTLAGWMEPASEVGGDTFDYTLDRDALQLSVTDAVGHHVPAALLATLLVGALRNARRRGLDLLEQVRYANDALAENATLGHFVTGQLVRVDLTTGAARVVNAGHPLPLRLRAGRVSTVELTVDPPFGVRPGGSFTVQPLTLEPGDRLVFLTDGMQERNAASLDVAAALADTADLHPREVVHALGAAVLGATGGDLEDDATMLCLDWYGGPSRGRHSEHGADPTRVSPPAAPR